MSGKTYGLILPSKKQEKQQLGTRTLNPLRNSDDELENEDSGLNWLEASLKKSAGNSGQKSLQKRMLKEALQEDSTIFQYDEVYDDIKASQAEELEKKRDSQQKKPKYIQTILKHSEKRKLENERRQERKIQKEREAEGNEFSDKESFVTPSYLKKLEELKKAAEEEKAEQIIEERNDIHKHKNFGVFYNHLFKQRLQEKEIKQEPLEDSEVIASSQVLSDPRKKNYRTQNDLEEQDESPERPTKEIKKEVVSSDNESETDIRDSYQSRNSRNENRENSRERRERSRSVEKPKRQENKSVGRNRENGSVTCQDKSEKYKRNRSRSTSRDRQIRDKRPRSRERYVRKKSSRSRSRERYGKGKVTRSRSRDRYVREGKSRSHSRDRKQSYKSRQRSRTRDVQRRSRERRSEIKKEISEETKISNGTEDRKDAKRLESSKSRSGNKENNNSKKESSGDDKKVVKQSISTTLGSTDINKMKIEDRINRFSEIFAKRNVGQKFQDAVQRYFQRKAERGS